MLLDRFVSLASNVRVVPAAPVRVLCDRMMPMSCAAAEGLTTSTSAMINRDKRVLFTRLSLLESKILKSGIDSQQLGKRPALKPYSSLASVCMTRL